MALEINGEPVIPTLRRRLIECNCEKHGKFETTWFIDNEGKPIGEPICPECKKEEDEQYRIIASKMYAEALVTSSLTDAGVPSDNFDSSFDSYIATTDEMKNKLDVCKKFVIKDNIYPSCLCFLGLCGTGKTHLAVSCIRAIIVDNLRSKKQEDKIKYTRASELMRDFKSIMNTKKGGTTENQLIREYQTYDFLVIDELGRYIQGDYSTSLIREIISYRIESNRKTILIMNGDFAELKSIVGEHIISRLSEKGKSLIFKEPDYRKKMQMERNNEESTNAV